MTTATNNLAIDNIKSQLVQHLTSEVGWGRWDLNPHDRLRSTDFKSVASTIPPRPRA